MDLQLNCYEWHVNYDFPNKHLVQTNMLKKVFIKSGGRVNESQWHTRLCLKTSVQRPLLTGLTQVFLATADVEQNKGAAGVGACRILRTLRSQLSQILNWTNTVAGQLLLSSFENRFCISPWKWTHTIFKFFCKLRSIWREESEVLSKLWAICHLRLLTWNCRPCSKPMPSDKLHLQRQVSLWYLRVSICTLNLTWIVSKYNVYGASNLVKMSWLLPILGLTKWPTFEIIIVHKGAKSRQIWKCNYTVSLDMLHQWMKIQTLSVKVIIFVLFVEITWILTAE